MKRILMYMSAVLLLSGCTRYDKNIEISLQEVFSRELSLSAIVPTFNSTYYDYYVEPCIGRVSSDRSSNVFAYNGIPFVMNLKIADIINSAYYPEAMQTEVQSSLKIVADMKDKYYDFEGIEHPFHVSIYELKDSYLVKMDTPYVVFYSESSMYESVNLAEKMLKIARSIKIDSKLVVSDFSNRQVISNTRKKIELFQDIAPENGMINELFENPDISIDRYPNVTDIPSIDGGNYATDNYPDGGDATQNRPNLNTIIEQNLSE